MNKTVSATQARKQFFQLITLAGKPGATVTVTLENHPSVIMMSQDEWEGWQETMEIMSDPELMADIQEGIADKDQGRTITLEEFERSLQPKKRKRTPSKRQRV